MPPLLLVPCGHRWCCDRETAVTCALFCCSWALWGCRLIHHRRGMGSQAPPILFPISTSSMCPSTTPPPFLMYRCVDLSGVLACWAEKPMLSFGCFTSSRLNGRDRGASNSTMMLTSLPEMPFPEFLNGNHGQVSVMFSCPIWLALHTALALLLSELFP